ncbi:hypothetical protein [Erythrobacter dokdonensis]|uniref:DUF4189 domain-containing protein n=1 Tax=Erythrobacter dokdonensis DSW-74 TaxID=1300349 RepID=A0A1A7BGH9_9SPHN|nr:hypothetical protein [Erythrobacter dokdonensis]OBV10522.1 hypothetical protein I603_2124 [Erythrobacter dokdonensis DSW-74]
MTREAYLIAGIVGIAVLAGDAWASNPAWTRYSASASGSTDARACAAARDKAAAHARAHLGLNLGQCRCQPAAEGQNRTCRINYEILTKE